MKKKVINRWDGGITTSTRDNNPDTSYGAQMVKHFDIYTDPGKLIPMPSWESFTTDEEKLYGIRALGGLSDTVYGIGKGFSNWYGTKWPYRVKVTADGSKYLATGVPLRISLADMPAGFWTHIKSDVTDVRVTDSTNATLPSQVENLDTTAHTGDLWVKGTFSDYVYVYYGNLDASAILQSTSGLNYLNSPTRVWPTPFAFTFANKKTNNTDPAYLLTPDPIYVDGLFGKAIYTNTEASTDSNKVLALSGSRISVSFMIKLNSAPGTTSKIIYDANGTWSISIDSSRKVRWFVKGVSGNVVRTSTAALTLGQWAVVDCVFDGNYYIAINGSKETFTSAYGSYDKNTSGNSLRIDSGNFSYIAQVWGFNDDLSSNQITTKYNNLTSAFWSFGSEESFSSITPHYTGTQVWQKLISGGSWEEYLQVGQPMRINDLYPVNGFVEQPDDLYFIVSTIENDAGFLKLARTDSVTGIEQPLLLSGNSTKLRPLSESPVDKAIYFSYGAASLGLAGKLSNSNMFAAYSQIASLVAWRNYLAMGSTRRNRANVEIWDLVLANPIEFIDAGMGNLRVVGNASDILFAVIDNFIDSEVLSSVQPTMEVRQYVGNGRMDSAIRVSVPATYSGWTKEWERAVSFFKLRRNTETLFYAKLPANETATEFNEGFWAVGKNSKGSLSLSLMIDTSEFDTPENVHGFAQQVFFVERSGGVQRLGSSYDKVSKVTTLKFNEGNSQIGKKLVGIELIFEPLEATQEISVYYKKNGDTTRTLIKTFAGASEIAFEALKQADGKNLPHYHEIEFDIESTKGKSAILEFNYKYEYLSDLV